LVARCGTAGMYTVNDQNKRGVPDIIREAKVDLIFESTEDIPYERTIVYKYNDDVKEVYNYLDIISDVTTAITDKVCF
jgi:ACT domain-containing protein